MSDSTPSYIDQVNDQSETNQSETAIADKTTKDDETKEVVSHNVEKSDTESDQAKQQDDQKKPEKPNNLQKRIDELTRQRHEKEREAAYWRELAQKAQGNKSTDGTPSDAPAKPTPDQYENYGDYLEAVTDYKAESKAREAVSKALLERDKQTQQKTYAEKHKESMEGFSERTKAFKEVATDFEEVVSQADDLIVSDELQALLLSSEYGPQIVYDLAKNRDEAKRILSLSPIQAAREIGKMESAFASKSQNKKDDDATAIEKATATVTKAPAPINPNRSSSGQFTKDPESMSDGEWLSWQKSQRKK